MYIYMYMYVYKTFSLHHLHLSLLKLFWIFFVLVSTIICTSHVSHGFLYIFIKNTYLIINKRKHQQTAIMIHCTCNRLSQSQQHRYKLQVLHVNNIGFFVFHSYSRWYPKVARFGFRIRRFGIVDSISIQLDAFNRCRKCIYVTFKVYTLSS